MSLNSPYTRSLSDLKYRIGKLINASKELNKYLDANPEIEILTDEKYQQLAAMVNRRKQDIIELSPTAKKRFANPETLPTLAPEANYAMTECLLIDQAEGLSSTAIDSSEIQNLVSPVTVKIPKFGKDGNPLYQTLEGEDGDINLPLYEDVTVFALNGNSMEEVTRNIGKLMSNIVSQATREIQTLREEIEENSDDTTLDQAAIDSLVLESVEKHVNANIQDSVLRTLESREGKQVLNNWSATNHYLELFDNYVEELKQIHLDIAPNGMATPKTLFGQTLLSEIAYIGVDPKDGKTKTMKSQGLGALVDYSFRELKEKFNQHNDSNSGSLFQNSLGSKDELNRVFVNMVQGSIDIALNKLVVDNPNLNRDAFNGEKPRNKFEPIQAKPDFLDNINNPHLLSVAASQNGYNGVHTLVAGQQATSPLPIPANMGLTAMNTLPEAPVYNNVPSEPAPSVDNLISSIPVANPNPGHVPPQAPNISKFDLEL